MSISRIAVAAAALTVLSALAAPATNVLGTWKGKLSIDKSKLPPNASPAQVAQGQAMFAKLALLLTLKKDGTFIFKLQGAPGQPEQKPQTGKWTIKGAELTIVVGNHPQKFTVAKNGKSFTAAQSSGVIATFTR
jgi:hypothetical protein